MARGRNYTDYEEVALLNLIERYLPIGSGNSPNRFYLHTILDQWAYLTAEYNKKMRIARGTQRNQKSLKDKFKNIKDPRKKSG
jgi:hypothetical protein